MVKNHFEIFVHLNCYIPIYISLSHMKMPKLSNTNYKPYHQHTKTATKWTKGDHTVNLTPSPSHIVGDQTNIVIWLHRITNKKSKTMKVQKTSNTLNKPQNLSQSQTNEWNPKMSNETNHSQEHIPFFHHSTHVALNDAFDKPLNANESLRFDSRTCRLLLSISVLRTRKKLYQISYFIFHFYN